MSIVWAAVSLITALSCIVSAFSFTRITSIKHHYHHYSSGQGSCSLSTQRVPCFTFMANVAEEGINSTLVNNLQEDVEQQLQMRFEEAMQRRIKRHKGIDTENRTNAAAETEITGEPISKAKVEETIIQDRKEETSVPKRSTIEDRDDKSAERAKQKRKASSKQQSSTKDYPRNDYKEYSWENPIITDDGGGYDQSEEYADSYPRPKRACEWETYRSTSILFPPLPSGRPKAILHFVGGTFFGSYPKRFYGSLLEDIATQCEAVVVASPIPVILPGKSLLNKLEQWMFDEGGSRKGRGNEVEKNPLDHVYLAETIQREFNNAYRDVILDEYFGGYADDAEVEMFMKNTPIIGIGHSLGARIQAVSCSHPHVSSRFLSMGKGRRLIRSGREGMIYLGFANWGASSSIPGLEQLERTVKKKEEAQKAAERRSPRGRRNNREGVGRQDDVWADRSTVRRRRTGYDDMRRRYNRYEYDGYDSEDLDITDIFSDVVTGVAKGVNQISDVLTPDADSLEFNPTPDELWEDLSAAKDGYMRACPNNLIVQFDQDPIDQGSRLTRTLLAASNGDKSPDIEATDQPLDIKFARLQGGHLTPVTFQDGIAKLLPKKAMSLFSSSYDFILQQFDDERTGKTTKKQQQEAKDVADTVSSYIQSLTSNK